MSLDNLATLPPSTYVPTGSVPIGAGSIFDIATPASPYNWIKSENRMGIIPITASQGPATILDVSRNLQTLAAYSEYGKAQLNGSSNATTIDNNGQPLGNRYFVFIVTGKQIGRAHV